MTNYKSTITELHYLADWAKHHLDKAKIANDAAVSIEALQSKLGDAIRSLANWQHQFTEAQAENERLKEEAKQWQSLSELSLGMAEAHSRERNALQAKLDELQRQEPVTHQLNFQGKAVIPLYAAPKALAPLTDEQKNSAWDDHWSNPSIPSTACSAFYAGMRFAEKHHGIGGPNA